MTSPVLFPLSAADRQALFHLMTIITDSDWSKIQECMSSIIDFTPNCRDSFRDVVASLGQAMFLYALIQLKKWCDKEIDIVRSSRTIYRYVWLEIDNKRVHVQSKGRLWYQRADQCLDKGLDYIPNCELPESFEHPRFILSLEAICICQHLEAPFTNDIYALPTCHCVHYHKGCYTTPCCPIDAGSGSARELCYQPHCPTPVNVIRLPWEIKTARKKSLYVFCIPRTDFYFYSHSRCIQTAFSEFLLTL